MNSTRTLTCKLMIAIACFGLVSAANAATPLNAIISVNVPAGETVRHADVLAAAFSMPDGVDAIGALALISDSVDIKIYSRTFNTTADGTYGQAMPGIAAADLVPADSKRRIMFFTENDDYRKRRVHGLWLGPRQ